MVKNPNDAKNMGGPSFHPEMEPQKQNLKKAGKEKAGKSGQILRDDQVPPL